MKMEPTARLAVTTPRIERLSHDRHPLISLAQRMPSFIADVLERHGVPASRLTVEVTESTIMADPKRALDVLGHLRDMGISLAIDDYGTGYSSLAYIQRLHCD
jgi:EAL domain-containing protein (putative c-di-GMP-specific phosphodiesterase class I)